MKLNNCIPELLDGLLQSLMFSSLTLLVTPTSRQHVPPRLILKADVFNGLPSSGLRCECEAARERLHKAQRVFGIDLFSGHVG